MGGQRRVYVCMNKISVIGKHVKANKTIGYRLRQHYYIAIGLISLVAIVAFLIINNQNQSTAPAKQLNTRTA